jgi:predicted ester cyclase
LIAEGDLVAARYLVQGTHQGEFLGIPGSGRQVRIQPGSTDPRLRSLFF